MRVRYCCTISCDVVRPDFIAACMSAMLASNTLKAAPFVLDGAAWAGVFGDACPGPGRGVWPADSSNSAIRLTVYFMESDLVASNEPENNPDQFHLRLLEMRGVIRAGDHRPRLVGRAETREQLGRDGERRLRVVVAVHQQRRHQQLRGTKGVELVLVAPGHQDRLGIARRLDER